MQDVTRRDFLKTAAVVGAGTAAGIGFPSVLRAQGGTVKVGVLHSLSGTMAISEVSLRDVCMMAFDEINAKGGVLGKKIEPVVVDPASNWDLFAATACSSIPFSTRARSARRTSSTPAPRRTSS